jgi:DNA-binding transcriptional LysR family regulator
VSATRHQPSSILSPDWALLSDPTEGEFMQMNQVRYFLALCEERSFTRAGRRCGIAQPSMTNAIGALEREFGGALFYRKPQIALTALGRAVYPYLDDIAKTADLARAAAQTMLNARPTHVGVATVESICE